MTSSFYFSLIFSCVFLFLSLSSLIHSFFFSVRVLFYKNIEAEIFEILRIFFRLNPRLG